MTTYRFDLLCLGEPLGELNSTRGEDGYRFGLGGDVVNCAVAAARQGARVAMLSALGDDRAGRAWRAQWDTDGVDHSAVATVPGGATGLYFVDHGPTGHVFTYRRADSPATRAGPAAINRDLIASARCLHVSGISLAISNEACDGALAAIEIARSVGTLVSFDTNLRLKLWPLPRARALIEAAAAMADIVLPGEDDARLLTGLDDPDAILDHYARRPGVIVALTLGKAGVAVTGPAGRWRLPAHPVAALDATGAGDCFDGAFLAEWLAHGDLHRAAVYANTAAALSTLGWGAIDPIPTRAQVEAALSGT
jgi:2-dehydro-3-deoxygluconokinase